MASNESSQSVINIVNAVQSQIGVNPTKFLDSTKQSSVLVALLNNTLKEINSFGDWQEDYVEVTIPAVAGQSEYTLYSAGIKYPIKRIHELSFNNWPQSLRLLTIEDYNRLRRTGGTGVPRQWTIMGVDDSGNPKIRVWPTPTSTEAGQLFTVVIYKKPRIIKNNDRDYVIPYPYEVVYLGLYARALMEENGNEQSTQSQQAFAEYQSAMMEALNRYNSDTGTDVYFVPQQRSRG